MSAVWTGAPLKGRHIKLCQLLWLHFWKIKEKILTWLSLTGRHAPSEKTTAQSFTRLRGFGIDEFTEPNYNCRLKLTNLYPQPGKFLWSIIVTLYFAVRLLFFYNKTKLNETIKCGKNKEQLLKECGCLSIYTTGSFMSFVPFEWGKWLKYPISTITFSLVCFRFNHCLLAIGRIIFYWKYLL